MDTPKSRLHTLIRSLCHYANDFEECSDYFRMRVHFAEHIYSTLDDIQTEIQRLVVESPQEKTQAVFRWGDITDSVSNQPTSNPDNTVVATDSTLTVIDCVEKPPQSGCDNLRPHLQPKPHRLPFRVMTLAQAGKSLLREFGQLHGKEIEHKVKEGGYRSKSRHFQQSLLSAFERDGAFENIGGNTWRLKPENPSDILILNGNQSSQIKEIEPAT